MNLKLRWGCQIMSRVTMVALAACLFAIGMVTPAISEDLVGTVVDRDGNAVPGVKIVTQAPDGQTTGTATSDAQGQYRIGGLDAGEYFITLNPAAANVQGQTVASYVGNAGLTVNWSVGHGLAPLASAQPGIRGGSSSPVGSIALAKASDPPPGCVKNGKSAPPADRSP